MIISPRREARQVRILFLCRLCGRHSGFLGAASATCGKSRKTHHRAHGEHGGKSKKKFHENNSLSSVNSVSSVVNISSSYTLRLGAFAGDTPDSLIGADTSVGAKNAHAFARVEDVALRPGQDLGFAVAHGASEANP